MTFAVQIGAAFIEQEKFIRTRIQQHVEFLQLALTFVAHTDLSVKPKDVASLPIKFLNHKY